MVLTAAGCVASAPPEGEAVVAPAAAPAVTTPEPTVESDPIVTANFASGGGRWEGAGSVMFRYTAIARNDQVYICGAFTGRGSTNIRKLTREVMRQAKVTSNGTTILRNLRSFAEVSNANFSTRLVGVETNCRATGRSVSEVPLDSVRVETRGGNYRL